MKSKDFLQFFFSPRTKATPQLLSRDSSTIHTELRGEGEKTVGDSIDGSWLKREAFGGKLGNAGNKQSFSDKSFA